MEEDGRKRDNNSRENVRKSMALESDGDASLYSK